MIKFDKIRPFKSEPNAKYQSTMPITCGQKEICFIIFLTFVKKWSVLTKFVQLSNLTKLDNFKANSTDEFSRIQIWRLNLTFLVELQIILSRIRNSSELSLRKGKTKNFQRKNIFSSHWNGYYLLPQQWMNIVISFKNRWLLYFIVLRWYFLSIQNVTKTALYFCLELLMCNIRTAAMSSKELK